MYNIVKHRIDRPGSAGFSQPPALPVGSPLSLGVCARVSPTEMAVSCRPSLITGFTPLVTASDVQLF